MRTINQGHFKRNQQVGNTYGGPNGIYQKAHVTMHNNSSISQGANMEIDQNQSMRSFKPSNQVLSEFQEAIQKANEITSKYVAKKEKKAPTFTNRSFNLPLRNTNQNILKKNEEKNIFIEEGEDLDIIPNDSNHNSQLDASKEDSFDLDELTNDIQNFNEGYIYDAYTPQENQYEKEINKLKLTNQVLIRSNLDLKNNNKILEVELNSYKNTNTYPPSNPQTEYDVSLAKFTTSLKNSLIESLNSNLNLMELIKSVQEQNQKLLEENVQLTSTFNGMANELQGANRKNAEIQITNQQNEQAIEELEDENKKLRIELDHRNLELSDLIAKEENLNLINESNAKKKKDNEELFQQFQITMENLAKSSNANSIQLNKNQKEMIELEGEIQNKKKEIGTLVENINKLKDEHNDILNQNKDIKNQIEENTKVESQLKQEEKELEKEVDIAKKENELIKHSLEEKKKIIELLKENINKVMNSINDNQNENQLTEEEVQNEIMKLDDEINEIISEIESKDKAINDISKYYQDIIKRNDEIIGELVVNQNNEENQDDYEQQVEEEDYNEDEGDYLSRGEVQNDNEDNKHITSIHELDED